MPKTDAIEFSRPLDVIAIGARVMQRKISANAKERQLLATRFALLALDRLDATLELRRGPDGSVSVSGHLSGRVTQACVVTLEPVHSNLEADFSRSFSEQASAEQSDVTLDFDVDEPDCIQDGQIDLGEVVAEEMALALDPYPRAPGAEFSPESGLENTRRQSKRK